MRRNYRIKLGLGYDEAKFNYLNNSQFSCFIYIKRPTRQHAVVVNEFDSRFFYMKCVPTLNWLVAQVKMVRVPVFATDHRADEDEEYRWEPTR